MSQFYMDPNVGSWQKRKWEEWTLQVSFVTHYPYDR